MPERNESILDFSSQILILLDLTKLYSLQLSPSKYEPGILTLTYFFGTSKNLSQFSTFDLLEFLCHIFASFLLRHIYKYI